MSDEDFSVTAVDVDAQEEAIREILSEYLTWLEQIVQRMVEDDYATDFEDVLERDFARFADPDETTDLFLARAGGHAVGFVYLHEISETRAAIKRLYVRPAHRGRGIGRALVTALVDDADQRGYETLQLTTSPGMKEAQKLYAEFGFEETEPFETSVPAEFHDVCRFMRLPLDDES